MTASPKEHSAARIELVKALWNVGGDADIFYWCFLDKNVRSNHFES